MEFGNNSSHQQGGFEISGNRHDMYGETIELRNDASEEMNQYHGRSVSSIRWDGLRTTNLQVV